MKILRRLLFALSTAIGFLVLAVLSLAIVACITFYSDRGPQSLTGAHSGLSSVERQEIAAEYPAYVSRGKEQTWLTLAEWHQVYSYNEFGDFLASGGRQTDFPFLHEIGSFWDTYFLSLRKSRNEAFHWQYNFVSWLIGINLTIEYSIKSAYENTFGHLTQWLAGSDTGADRFIATSWNSFAGTLYQTTWYHYPYFSDMRDIWLKTATFDRRFARNAERKIAFSVSYLIKALYAQLWLLTAEQKDNQTFSIVHADHRASLDGNQIRILKELSGSRFLIETDRYAGFKTAMSSLLERDATFIEIMGHQTIALSYLSRNETEPFAAADIIDQRALFFHPDGYKYRVTLEARVDNLKQTLRLIGENGASFEMIYDF